MTGAAIRCDSLAFSYGDAPMAFDLILPAGAVVALMGPSGSGKSTLLSLIAGFETPSAGRILIDGRDVTRDPPAARPVSMVFQENNLFGHLDVVSNVGLGRSPALKLTTRDRQEVTAALARVGLAGMEKRLPRELSGGERQRVALARVLVRDRPVLLLDEPFAALGPALKADMLALLTELHAERGMTVLMATHDPDDARAASSLLAFVEAGRIAAFGPTGGFFGDAVPEAFRRYAGNAKR
jgi:thiamine transport system ATP-binding protein